MNGYCAITGKVRFETQHKAARQLRVFGNGGTIYRCDHCHEWHVAHAPPQANKLKRLKREQAHR